MVVGGARKCDIDHRNLSIIPQDVMPSCAGQDTLASNPVSPERNNAINIPFTTPTPTATPQTPVFGQTSFQSIDPTTSTPPKTLFTTPKLGVGLLPKD